MKEERFYVVKCNAPKCLQHQIVEIRTGDIIEKSFKCKYCGYKSRYHKKGMSIILVGYDGPYTCNIASEVCKTLKISKNQDQEGFYEHRIRGK